MKTVKSEKTPELTLKEWVTHNILHLLSQKNWYHKASPIQNKSIIYHEQLKFDSIGLGTETVKTTFTFYGIQVTKFADYFTKHYPNYHHRETIIRYLKRTLRDTKNIEIHAPVLGKGVLELTCLG